MAEAVIAGVISAGGAAISGATIAGVIAAGVVTAGTALLQERAADKRQEALERANDEQKRQVAIANAQQDVARTRAIKQTIAQARVDRAELEQRAFAGGPEGVGQSITGDVGSAIGAANTQRAAQFGISQSQNREADFRVQAQSRNRFDVLAGITGAFGQGIQTFNAGGFEGLSNFNFGANSGLSRPSTGGAEGEFGFSF